VQRDPKATTRSGPESCAATEDTSAATKIGGGEAEGSRNPVVRVVPFQSLPQSAQEEMGKELFDNPLLSIKNVKKLTDYMQWSFKYTKVMPSSIVVTDIE